MSEIVLACPSWQAEVTDTGRLILHMGEGSIMEIGLLPFDRSYSNPFPYGTFHASPFRPELLDPSRRDCSPTCGWMLKEEAGKAILLRTLGDWQLWQEISLAGDCCRIESFMDVPSFCEPPRNLNVAVIPQQAFMGNARQFLMGASMGRTRIVDFSEVQEGDGANCITAFQTAAGAVQINSVIGSDRPLQFVFSDGAWHGMVDLPPLPGPNPVSLGAMEIRCGADAHNLLEGLAASTGKKNALRPAPRCWNSWDYYHSSISYERIMANAAAIAADPVLKESVDCITLDMGWETRFGEWTADPNFPGGMGRMADGIRKLGFQAGLWLAPIIIDPECNFFQDDYDWVARNSYGFPDRSYDCCGLLGYVLDVTRKEGADYLRDLFRGFREMGYTYYKLDFLKYMMFVHRFRNGELANVEVMRRALGLIREGAGDDAYILGCNLPFAVGPGYCDACRVTGDVSVFWSAIKRNAAGVGCTSFLNGQWWMNDPDFLVARGKDTFDTERRLYGTWWFPRQDEMDKDPSLRDIVMKMHSRPCTLSLEEARTHASLELLLGGARVLGDPVMHLNEAGLEIIRRVAAADTAPGRPLDLFASGGLASVWRQELDDRVRFGLFNWEDYSQTVSLSSRAAGFDLSGRKTLDFWSGASVILESGDNSFLLAPHSCRVLEVYK